MRLCPCTDQLPALRYSPRFVAQGEQVALRTDAPVPQGPWQQRLGRQHRVRLTELVQFSSHQPHWPSAKLPTPHLSGTVILGTPMSLVPKNLLVVLLCFCLPYENFWYFVFLFFGQNFPFWQIFLLLLSSQHSACLSGTRTVGLFFCGTSGFSFREVFALIFSL